MIGILNFSGLALLRVALALTAGVWALPAAAAQANLCVTCNDPAQTYVCSVDSPLAHNSQALQLYCVIKIAKEGGHKSCAVSREAAPGNCPGVVKSYRYDGPGIPTHVRSGEGNFVNPRPPADETAAKKDGPPDTLVEAARGAPGAASRVVRTVGVGAAKGAGHAAKSVGSKIGDAARNAVDCVTSLFRGCGSRSE